MASRGLRRILHDPVFVGFGSPQRNERYVCMKRVVLEELTPGMVLAKPVTNAGGMVVLAAAATLDDAMIVRLRQLGLASVFVEGEAGDSSGKTLVELEAELDHRFSRVSHDPQQRMILEAIRQHLRATHGVGDAPAESP